MKIKKGDTVKIITGKDKGKTGTVVRAYPQESRIVIEGLNLVVKHVKARKQGEKGQKLYIPARLGISKVMLVCKGCSKATRVGYRLIDTDGKKTKMRVCKKCTQTI
ncbi:50S ribosomal protein L24 [Candidatus Uhrbacteria bacterium]|nr:50S ribosomal protein L24 [Candidatus Uhrbacteria bacterium]